MWTRPSRGGPHHRRYAESEDDGEDGDGVDDQLGLKALISPLTGASTPRVPLPTASNLQLISLVKFSEGGQQASTIESESKDVEVCNVVCIFRWMQTFLELLAHPKLGGLNNALGGHQLDFRILRLGLGRAQLGLKRLQLALGRP